jgi:hypothetical protein
MTVEASMRFGINGAHRKRILTMFLDLALGVFLDLGSGADEQCQRIGGGYKAVTFRFLLFL